MSTSPNRHELTEAQILSVLTRYQLPNTTNQRAALAAVYSFGLHRDVMRTENRAALNSPREAVDKLTGSP